MTCYTSLVSEFWILRRWRAQPSIRQYWLCSHIVFAGLVLAASLISEATWQMVVNDPGNLHEGVDCCRANTLEPPAHQVLAYGFSFRRLCRYLTSIAEAVCDGPVVHKAPAVVAERSEFFNNLQVSIRKFNTWNTKFIKIYDTTHKMFDQTMVNCKPCIEEAHVSHYYSDSQRV